MTVQLFFKMLTAFIMSIFAFFSGTAPAKVAMIAHRGYSGSYPENTALAFEMAAKHGSEGAETDVRVTKDGVLVLSHNEQLVFNDGSELIVAESTYDELAAKPLKNEKTNDTVYVCTFKEYLEIMKANDMICFIEFKDEFNDEQVKAAFTMAQEVYDLSKCILQSFEFDNLVRAHEMFPDLPIMLTYGAESSDYERCFEYGFSIDVDFQIVTKEMIEAFHSRGLKVALWTANNRVELAYCKSLGVDYIESDKLA